MPVWELLPTSRRPPKGRNPFSLQHAACIPQLATEGSQALPLTHANDMHGSSRKPHKNTRSGLQNNIRLSIEETLDVTGLSCTLHDRVCALSQVKHLGRARACSVMLYGRRGMPSSMMKFRHATRRCPCITGHSLGVTCICAFLVQLIQVLQSCYQWYPPG